MWPRIAADAVTLVHLAFIVFVLAGGLLAWWRPRLALLHLPALAWGVGIELTGAICPLTPLELHLRRAAGGTGYEGSFVEHYLVPLIYPVGLTRGMQFAIAAVVLLLNIVIYAGLIVRMRRRPTTSTSTSTSARA